MPGIVTTYLEMTARDQLRPKRTDRPEFRVLEAKVKQWEYNRFLYVLVGRNWSWTDRLKWTDDQWRAKVEAPDVRTFVGYVAGSPAGYFELRGSASVEIEYFGLTPAFIGRGLGGALLTTALEEAWNGGAARIWVHTCTADHPSALSNYIARGMTVFNVETA